MSQYWHKNDKLYLSNSKIDNSERCIFSIRNYDLKLRKEKNLLITSVKKKSNIEHIHYANKYKITHIEQ